MSVHLRQIMQRIPSYKPGGCPEEQGEASARKLSSNELPWAPPQPVVEAITKAANTLNRYPDFYKEQLCAELATHYNTRPDMISVDNGSGTLLQDLVRIVCDQNDEVVYCTPTFAAYDIDVLLAGANPVHVSLSSTYHFDLSAMAQAITPRTRMCIVCNPNNPTGTFLSTEELGRFIASIPSDILVVIDEAYRDFVTTEPYEASQSLLERFDNVALLRTFSKAYGLAGLRVGFCLAQPEVIEAINKTIAEFSVSALGQAAALACLEPQVFANIYKHIDEIITTREWFERRLQQAGISYIPSQANFVMLPGLGMKTFDACAQAGVIVRPFDNPNGIRISIGTREEMELAAKGLGL